MYFFLVDLINVFIKKLWMKFVVLDIIRFWIENVVRSKFIVFEVKLFFYYLRYDIEYIVKLVVMFLNFIGFDRKKIKFIFFYVSYFLIIIDLLKILFGIFLIWEVCLLKWCGIVFMLFYFVLVLCVYLFFCFFVFMFIWFLFWIMLI